MTRVIVKECEHSRRGACFPRHARSFQNTDRLFEGGDASDQFLEEYPSLSRELAIAAIEEAKTSLVSQLQ